jgi:hypothetical protein
MTIGYRKSLQIAGMVGATIGVGFVILGLGLHSIHIPVIDIDLGKKGATDINLILIGALCAMDSFSIYYRAIEMSNYRKN